MASRTVDNVVVVVVVVVFIYRHGLATVPPKFLPPSMRSDVSSWLPISPKCDTGNPCLTLLALQQESDLQDRIVLVCVLVYIAIACSTHNINLFICSYDILMQVSRFCAFVAVVFQRYPSVAVILSSCRLLCVS